MSNEKLMLLLEKQFVNLDELDEISIHSKVLKTEFNGTSGQYNNKWYSVYLENGEEFQIYL